MDEVYRFSTTEMDSTKTLIVRSRTATADYEADEWAPLSPLFLNVNLVHEAANSPGLLEVRWIGNPPRPAIGSTLAATTLDCAVIGDVPAGQETWADSAGVLGQRYRVTSRVARCIPEGSRIVRTSGRPQIVTYGVDQRAMMEQTVSLFPHTHQSD